jgi:hypothetical protein
VLVGFKFNYFYLGFGEEGSAIEKDQLMEQVEGMKDKKSKKKIKKLINLLNNV